MENKTTDLKCVFVVLYGILAVQKMWSSSTRLGCLRRGKTVVCPESSAGASFITTWEVVAECLRIVLINETYVKTVEYTCGLVRTSPCHFSLWEDECKEVDRLFRGWKIILVFCYSVLTRGGAGIAWLGERVCIKCSIVLNKPDLIH